MRRPLKFRVIFFGGLLVLAGCALLGIFVGPQELSFETVLKALASRLLPGEAALFILPAPFDFCFFSTLSFHNSAPAAAG